MMQVIACNDAVIQQDQPTGGCAARQAGVDSMALPASAQPDSVEAVRHADIAMSLQNSGHSTRLGSSSQLRCMGPNLQQSGGLLESGVRRHIAEDREGKSAGAALVESSKSGSTTEVRQPRKESSSLRHKLREPYQKSKDKPRAIVEASRERPDQSFRHAAHDRVSRKQDLSYNRHVHHLSLHKPADTYHKQDQWADRHVKANEQHGSKSSERHDSSTERQRDGHRHHAPSGHTDRHRHHGHRTRALDQLPLGREQERKLHKSHVRPHSGIRPRSRSRSPESNRHHTRRYRVALLQYWCAHTVFLL